MDRYFISISIKWPREKIRRKNQKYKFFTGFTSLFVVCSPINVILQQFILCFIFCRCCIFTCLCAFADVKGFLDLKYTTYLPFILKEKLIPELKLNLFIHIHKKILIQLQSKFGTLEKEKYQ